MAEDTPIHVYDAATAPRCPKCGRVMSGFKSAGANEHHRPPAPGDLTLCAYCLTCLELTPDRTLSILTDEQAQRSLTPAAWSEILAARRMLAMQRPQ
jgi:hypothetical protein